MIQITIDDAMLAKLEGLDKPIEFTNTEGKVLGRFIPITAFRPSLKCSVSTEELKRRMANKGKTSTTAEVMARLQSLETS